mgnify:CR=1 FL=1
MIHNKIQRGIRAGIPIAVLYFWNDGSAKWNFSVSCSADFSFEPDFCRTVCRTYGDCFQCFFDGDGIDSVGGKYPLCLNVSFSFTEIR